MSDLSAPPLTLVPPDGAPSGHWPEPLRSAGDPFAWPTPALACYPAATGQVLPEPCTIEGTNGQVMTGRLMAYRPEMGVAQVLVPPSRTPLGLRFGQFRRLWLDKSLKPLTLTGAAEADGLAARPSLPYKLILRDGSQLEGYTVGHDERAEGLYVFEPLDDQGTLRRGFVPRAAYVSAEIGLRIGELLVAQDSTTPDQVETALVEQQALRSRKLGDLLVMRQIVTPEELVAAIEQQARMPMVRIGEALIALGFITQAQLDEALAQQRADRGVPLGELLVRSGAVSRQDLQTALARKMGYPLVDVVQFPVEVDALSKVPYAVASRVRALPLIVRGGRIVVAVEDPTRGDVVAEVEFAAQCKVVPVLARCDVLPATIDRAYERLGAEVAGRWPSDAGGGVEFDIDEASRLLASLEQQQSAEGRDQGGEEAPIEQSDNSLVRLINSMILEAHTQGISDIHVECPPGRDKVRIRFRKDGRLRPYLELPHTYRSAIIARLKIMCDLDISERRKPQDGKINFAKFVQGQRLELRLATIPTHSNLEDAVLRLLSSARPIPLDDLGLSPDNLKRFKDAVKRPYGMLLCVGPTGSGKTTTLHSAMGYINVPERKLWTAEDPIEITQPGLRQVQVNARIDWTFAKALRSFLRADPDVIMVGEIRDQETAQVAIEASLTGHLVLSTLHTNSAAETVTRLLDMGMDPFNFADALLGVLAQRLVRRLCTHCRLPDEVSADVIQELLGDYMHVISEIPGAPGRDEVLADWMQRFGGDGKLTTYRPVGCDHCDHTGYRGRAAIHELISVTRGLRRLIQTGTRADELLQHALAEGMRTLRQDGIEKVLAGVTTIDEVRAST
jgi:type II secretory ATPase GspE/PulE/Tfp pilus assembly ATPase PilB-like protein